MDLYTKKNIFLQALREKDLENVFKINEAENGDIWFLAEQNIKNSRCVISIVLRNNDITPVHFFLGNLDNPAKEEQMLELMNYMNNQNLFLKFTLDNKGIYASFPYLTSGEDFNALDLLDWTFAAYQTLDENYYSKIMKIMWA